MTTVAAVETALRREKDSNGVSLRTYVNRVEREYGSRRTVIIWINGMGNPVQTARQAIDKARAVAE